MIETSATKKEAQSMDLASFRNSRAGDGPPDALSQALCALWWDAKGDWQKAHQCAQAQDDAIGAWVHAYLHRKEGDLNNAGGWYRRAGKAPATGPLEAEWDVIADALLAPATSPGPTPPAR
jgi:hypothetical protein